MSGSRPGGSLPVLKVSAMQERNIDMTIPEFKRGTVRANGLEFHYLEAGKGPLALCYHGFPDSPYTYRHLLPALAEAGYRAVAPFIRGFAPTEVPPDRRHIHTSLMAADQNALHEALGGSGDAILLAHDWGAVGAYGAAGKAPDRWKKCVIMNIPPFQIFGKNLFSYAQIKKSFYFWFFQMQEVSGDVVSANNFEFIDNIWADWSPGYDASEDLPLVKECLRNPEHFQTAMGYYWGQFDPVRFGSPVWLEEQEAAWGYSLTQPTLYLHGSQDGCHGLDKEQVQSVLNYVGKGSEAELIDGVGHFMPLQKPAEINARILRFLKKS
jgi:pimeloyl-ACP methyl ester carboxylesterase